QRRIFASPDGRTLVLPYFNTGPADTRVYTYDSSNGTLTPRQATSTWNGGASMSRNMSRIILADMSWMQTTVYDAEFNVLGTLGDRVSLPLVSSPDGNFAYAYYSPEGRVRKFNVGATDGVTEVGPGSVVAPANT